MTHHACDDLAEYHVLCVQPPSLCQQDVELGAVGVGTVVGHGYPACGTMTQNEVLVVESLSEYALAYKREKRIRDEESSNM